MAITKEQILEKQDKVRAALELPELDLVNSDADVLMLLLKYNIQLIDVQRDKYSPYQLFIRQDLYAYSKANVYMEEGLERNWCVANAVLTVMFSKLKLHKIKINLEEFESHFTHTLTVKK